MRHHNPRSAALLVLLGSALLWPRARALAQSVPAPGARAPAEASAAAKADARACFERGIQLGRAGDDRQAAAEFQRAYQLSPHYAVLYNLGQAQLALDQRAEAVETLQRYLTEGGPNIPPRRRAEVQATIKQQQAHISTGYQAQPQAIASDEKAHVTVVMERVPPAAGPATAITPVAASVSPPAPSSVAAPAPQAEPEPPLLTRSPEPAPDQTAHGKFQRTLGFVSGGIGLAMGAVALGCYLWNKSRFDDYEAAQVNDQSKADSIRNVSAVTVGLTIGGGILVATGVALVLTATPRTTAASAGLTGGSTVAIGPGGISWRTTW